MFEIESIQGLGFGEIVAISVLSALLILLVLICILWKIGFFRRKTNEVRSKEESNKPKQEGDEMIWRSAGDSQSQVNNEDSEQTTFSQNVSTSERGALLH